MRAEVEDPPHPVRGRKARPERPSRLGPEPARRGDVSEDAARPQQLESQLEEDHIQVGGAPDQRPATGALPSGALQVLDAHIRRVADHMGEPAADIGETRAVEGVSPFEAPRDPGSRVALADRRVEPGPARRER